MYWTRHVVNSFATVAVITLINEHECKQLYKKVLVKPQIPKTGNR